MIQKLKQYFHVVNLYFNNHALLPGGGAVSPHGRIKVLFVNKRLGIHRPV